MFSSNLKTWKITELLCVTAQKGLVDNYSRDTFFEGDTIIKIQHEQLNMTSNLRYITIAQIGIKHWQSFHKNSSLPDLWEHIIRRRQEIDTAGDLGLAIWAGAESKASDCVDFVEKLTGSWERIKKDCNAVELAWVVQGMVCFSQFQQMSKQMTRMLTNARDRLIALYCADSQLFARHHRKGFGVIISRRIACFADQVYPILALANYGKYFKHDQSIEIAAAVADSICRLQGPKGQWWWHYHVKTATVSEEYPVFSVHQDAMGPMALLAIDEAAGSDHNSYIEKGLGWLEICNESNKKMIVSEKGIIWRDIHRREIGKMYREIRGLFITEGLSKLHRLAGSNIFGFLVNEECRPYHLGWILYSWANQLPESDKLSGYVETKSITREV